MPWSWRGFALLGAFAFVLALLEVLPAVADGSFLAYPPLAVLQLAVLVLLTAPLLPLNRRFYDVVIRPQPEELPTLHRWAYRVFAHWLAALAAIVGLIPGLFLERSASAVLLFFGLALLTAFVLLKSIAGAQRAAFAVWFAAALFALAPTLLNAGWVLFLRTV